MKSKDVIKLIVSIGVPLLAGRVEAVVTMPAISTWYATLNKPWFAPGLAIRTSLDSIIHFNGLSAVLSMEIS